MFYHGKKEPGFPGDRLAGGCPLGMWNWMRKKRPPLLEGAPALRRQKHYTAESGYVYHYYYCGSRPAGRGTEYVFEVSAEGAAPPAVRVLLGEQALEPWQAAHGRLLSLPERYAVAKLSLLGAFDRCPTPSEMPPVIAAHPAGVAEILAGLGVE